MEKLIFYWGGEGYGSKIFRINEDGKKRFVNRYSSMDFDENDNEIWRQGEVEYGSFEEYWKEFISHAHWFHYHPVFIHDDYKPFIREFLDCLNQESLSEGERLQLDYWLGKIVNED